MPKLRAQYKTPAGYTRAANTMDRQADTEAAQGDNGSAESSRRIADLYRQQAAAARNL